MIMAQLKEATRTHHDRMERDPLSRGLNQAQPTHAYYLQVLSAYYGFYAPLEQRLQAAVDWQAHGFDLHPRLKTDLLVHDLLALGATGVSIAQIPHCPLLPPLSDLPTALGCLYVLEGSTLGGQLMARHLAATLELDATNGAAFFNSYGPEVGPMWKAFRSFVDAQPESSAPAIIASACATFSALEHWFAAAHQQIFTPDRLLTVPLAVR
jgi:heme oxygenase